MRALALGAGLVALAGLCPLPARTATFVPPTPRLPSFMDDTVDRDADWLGSMLEDFYRQKGEAGRAEDFLFAYVPARLFALMLEGQYGPADMPQINGVLYISGHQGGVWLNEIMGRQIAPAGMIKLFRRPLLAALDRRCAHRRRLLESGSVPDKREELDQSFDLLVRTYGYNRGYLLEILRRPPAGGELPADYVVCEGLLECRYTLEYDKALTPLLPVRAKLETPPDESWRVLHDRLADKLPAAVAQGEKVWMNLMSRGQLSPENYRALVDVSAMFLMLNEAVLLEAGLALAEGDESASDRALLADTALTVWLTGYVIGLGGKDVSWFEPW